MSPSPRLSPTPSYSTPSENDQKLHLNPQNSLFPSAKTSTCTTKSEISVKLENKTQVPIQTVMPAGVANIHSSTHNTPTTSNVVSRNNTIKSRERDRDDKDRESMRDLVGSTQTTRRHKQNSHDRDRELITSTISRNVINVRMNNPATSVSRTVTTTFPNFNTLPLSLNDTETNTDNENFEHNNNNNSNHSKSENVNHNNTGVKF